jgi:nicotinamidase/pyrazinamidase
MIRRRQFLLGTASAFVMGGTPAIVRAQSVKPGDGDVLVITDVQNCFLPGGTLPVPEGDKIIPIINRLGALFRNVVMTQDWHTAGHVSFASSHPGKKPFETIQLPYGTQVLWPDHCVQGTADADMAKELRVPHAQLVIRKGYRQHVDSYSAFLEADRKTMTGLTGYLKERGLKSVYFTGLATDFCVAWSALDARRAGFDAAVIEDATRGIDAGGSLARAWSDMTSAGVKRVQSTQLLP